jgi:hypothetical protein
MLVGLFVEVLTGLLVGLSVGLLVGLSVGPYVGYAVGLDVGETGEDVGVVGLVHHVPLQFPSQRDLRALHQSPPSGTPLHPL